MQLYEPFEEDGQIGFVRIDTDSHSWSIVGLEDLDDNSPLLGYLDEMIKIWEFPGKPRINECLAMFEGYEQGYFDVEAGDYGRRFANVSQRIAQFFHTNFRFLEKFAEEILTSIILDSYFKNEFQYALRMIIQGMPGSGKTNLLRAMAKLSYRGWFVPIGASAASIYHSMGDFNVTPMIDELQDYDQDTRRVIDNIIKGGILRGATISRTVPDAKRGWRTEFYNAYAPITFVNQSGSYLRDEVSHRSFNLYMVDMDDPTIPVLMDEREISDIRTELYTLRCIWLTHPEYMVFEKIQSLKNLYIDTAEKLQNPPPDWPRLTGRARDLATTAFTLARLQGCIEEMQEIFDDKHRRDDEMFASGADGEVFNALAEMLMAADPIVKYGRIGQRMKEISTRDIARHINEARSEDREGGRTDEIRTIVVTRKIKAMGLEIETGQKNNLTMISEKSEKMFLKLMNKYGKPHVQAHFAQMIT